MGTRNLIPIKTLKNDDLRNVVRLALRRGLDEDAIADFLASVDWSGADRHRPRIATVLGQLEGWSSQYKDGHLTHAQYVARLLSLLPEDERRRRIVMGSGEISLIGPFQQRGLALSGQLPQSGSGAPAHLAQAVH